MLCFWKAMTFLFPGPPHAAYHIFPFWVVSKPFHRTFLASHVILTLELLAPGAKGRKCPSNLGICKRYQAATTSRCALYAINPMEHIRVLRAGYWVFRFENARTDNHWAYAGTVQTTGGSPFICTSWFFTHLVLDTRPVGREAHSHPQV